MPSPDALISVYGGNGISGYTSTPLPGLTEQLVVIGRVGQFCGVTHVTDKPVWVTDNALYPAHLDASMNMRFLAICLKGINLNRGKLGQYLPLITQKVIHSARIPSPSLHDQEVWVERYDEIASTSESILKRAAKATNSYQWLLNVSLSGG